MALQNEWQKIVKSQRWVVKIGSALLTADGQGLDTESIAGWVEQMAWLRQQGVEIVLVSSGSIAEGMSRLGMTARPKQVQSLQAAAAVGQMGLVQAYESSFQRYQMLTAQILLTHDDLSNRQRYLNARSTIRELLRLGVIPIINENDTIVTDEIRFGDNDSLGALVTNLVEADTLVILTDQLGLHRSDPRKNPDAALVSQAYAHDQELSIMAGGSAGVLGQGGMATKVNAGRLAARSGANTIIVGGRQEHVLKRLYQGERLGTLLVSDLEKQAARKRWLAGQLQAKGTLVLDDGAVSVLKKKGRSLLSVGVASVQGSFVRGDMVTCESSNGERIARGLVNYNNVEAQKICGKHSDQIESLLGYVSEPELIHRDNLVVL